MKKYSSEHINRLTWQEWNELMAKELNAAGYKAKEFNGREWTRTGKYSADCEPEYFGQKLDVEGLEYLKEIGLVNNGRCMQCGKPIYGTPGRFTDGFNHDWHYQICQDCVKTRGGMIKPNQPHGGCLIALLLFPLALIKGIIG